MPRRALISLVAALCCTLPLLCPPSPAAAASFAACPSDPAFACAKVVVPLDRSGAVPGTIALSVERRASAAGPSRSAVVALAGGPGQAALPLAHYLAEAISPALGNRDLLLFDQRGTGSSGQLSCAALSGPELAAARAFSEVIERCARQLGPARGDYTTTETVEDIEAVRRAAGYEKLLLYGTSYGTKVALEYAQRYPRNVEALVLDSVESAEGPDPFRLGTFKAIGPMLGELCSARACSHITTNPVRDLARLIGATSSRPLRAPAFDGRGRRSTVTITATALLGLLLDGDLNPVIRAELPAAVHSAVRNDPVPLARLFALNSVSPTHGEPGETVDAALYIDTSCEEDPFPWKRSASEATRAVEAEAALNALPGADFYPFAPETALLLPPITLCVSWPNASAAPPPPAPLPVVPTLIFSGGQDLRTPTVDAQTVAASIPGAQLVRVPYTGHSVIGSDPSGCARAALAAFFAATPVRPCAGVRDLFPLAPLAPRSLADVAAFRGVAGRRGRTLSAAIASLLDVRRSIVELALNFGRLPVGASFGGLRGGSATMTGGGVRLKGLAYVPGVRLSGFLPTGIVLKDEGHAGVLQVSGGAATGSLRFAQSGRIAGTLDGRRVAVDARAQVRAAAAAAAPAAEPATVPGPLARIP